MDYKDYYKTLNLSEDASKDEIKRAYRKLARKYHPDVNKEVAAEIKFKEINEAHEVLSDPEKRKAYDALGSSWQADQGFNSSPNWNSRHQNGSEGTQQASAEQHSEFFESLFGRRGHEHFSTEEFSSFGGQHQDRGDDLHAKVSIALEDSYFGAKRTITLNRKVNDGSGRLTIQPQSLQISIPKGVIEGQQIRLESQGEIGYGGEKRGDLFLQIVFEPHPLFTVRKRDISLLLPVTPWEAALGATIAVPTLGGNVDLKLPANSQSGRKLRLKDRGLSSKKQSGNQYVTIAIHTPVAATAEQRKLYERMAELMPYNPRYGVGG